VLLLQKALGLNVRTALALIGFHIFEQPKLICSRFCDFRSGAPPEVQSFQRKDRVLTDYALDSAAELMGVWQRHHPAESHKRYDEMFVPSTDASVSFSARTEIVIRSEFRRNSDFAFWKTFLLIKIGRAVAIFAKKFRKNFVLKSHAVAMRRLPLAEAFYAAKVIRTGKAVSDM
jgi:hypothetical protein